MYEECHGCGNMRLMSGKFCDDCKKDMFRKNQQLPKSPPRGSDNPSKKFTKAILQKRIDTLKAKGFNLGADDLSEIEALEDAMTW